MGERRQRSRMKINASVKPWPGNLAKGSEPEAAVWMLLWRGRANGRVHHPL